MRLAALLEPRLRFESVGHDPVGSLLGDLVVDVGVVGHVDEEKRSSIDGVIVAVVVPYPETSFTRGRSTT